MNKVVISNEFINRWEIFYGQVRTKSIVNNLMKPDARIITPNSLKCQIDPLKRQLENRGFKFTQNDEFSSLIVEFEPFNIVSTPEYLAGMFSIQALTSLIPPKILKPLQDGVVVDMTASPGIKTCFLAQEMNNRGTIIAIEKSKTRIPALKANISRMGIMNTIVLNGDAIDFFKFNIQADNILLDAPCSGTGLKLSKNKRLEPKVIEDVYRHAELQKILLESAWKILKSDGTLVYSTCSLEPEEGEIQILDFIKRHKNAQILPISIDVGFSGGDTTFNNSKHSQLRNSRRFFPETGYDGFFTALIQKSDL